MAKKAAPAPTSALQPWMLKALVGVTIAIMAMLIGTGNKSEGVTYLNARDTEQLKDVFFGNGTFTVLCVNETTVDRPLSKAFQYSAKKFAEESAFGVLDCGAKLPSGKTIYEKLQLKKDADPCIFLSLPGEKPKQIPPKRANAPTKLVKYLKDSLRPRMFEIANTKGLHKRCSGAEKSCLLIFRSAVSGAGLIAEEISRDHGDITIGLLDKRKRLALAGVDEVTALFFQNHTASADPAITRGVRLYAGEITPDNMDQFLLSAKIDAPEAPLVPLRKAPRVVSIKKDEEAPKKKKKKDALEENAEAVAEAEARARAAMEAMTEDLIKEDDGEEEEEEEEEEDEEEFLLD